MIHRSGKWSFSIWCSAAMAILVIGAWIYSCFHAFSIRIYIVIFEAIFTAVNGNLSMKGDGGAEFEDLPLWLILIAVSLPLGRYWFRKVRHVASRHQRLIRMARRHICQNCGYDARATPDRCP